MWTTTRSIKRQWETCFYMKMCWTRVENVSICVFVQFENDSTGSAVVLSGLGIPINQSNSVLWHSGLHRTGCSGFKTQTILSHLEWTHNNFMKQPSTQNINKTLQWQCNFLVTFIQSAPWRTPDHLEYCRDSRPGLPRLWPCYNSYQCYLQTGC